MIFSSENPPDGFYVYVYLRENNTPYYVGKGHGVRAWKKHKGEVRPPKDSSRILIESYGLDEKTAFQKEIELILKWGRKDIGTGILRNKTNGGEGSSGHVKTLEWRKNHSAKLKDIMKNAPSPMQGKKQTQEHIEKRIAIHRGAKRSLETRQKIKEKAKGRVQTEEQIKKRILYVDCEVCSKKIDKGNYTRWHGDKCKLKMKG